MTLLHKIIVAEKFFSLNVKFIGNTVLQWVK